MSFSAALISKVFQFCHDIIKVALQPVSKNLKVAVAARFLRYTNRIKKRRLYTWKTVLSANLPKL